jgi:transcriptional regulator with XRE-family HTH domain
MPKHAPDHDPQEFAQRLKEAMADNGLTTGYGAGTFLSRRYKSSPVTAHAWLNGSHMPNPDRVQGMADDLGVRFEWLYFGQLPKRAPSSQLTDSSRQSSPNGTLTMSPRELALVQKYRAANDTLRAMVDAALSINPKISKEK